MLTDFLYNSELVHDQVMETRIHWSQNCRCTEIGIRIVLQLDCRLHRENQVFLILHEHTPLLGFHNVYPPYFHQIPHHFHIPFSIKLFRNESCERPKIRGMKSEMFFSKISSSLYPVNFLKFLEYPLIVPIGWRSVM
jgi:hypothetical protein